MSSKSKMWKCLWQRKWALKGVLEKVSKSLEYIVEVWTLRGLPMKAEEKVRGKNSLEME